MSSRSAPPVSELSLVSLASYLDTQQSAGYREGLADVADPRPRRGLGMRGDVRTVQLPCISDLGSSAHDLGAFFVVGILSHPATRMRSGSKINNTCHPHATVPECCAQADLPVRCTRRRTRVPPFLMRPANFCLFLTPFGSFEHLPHLLLPHPC